MTKTLRGLGILAIIGVVLLVLMPKLSTNQGPEEGLPTVYFEGSTILFPQNSNPTVTKMNNARRDPNQALLIIRWRGNRVFTVSWQTETIDEQDHDIPALPNATEKTLTTFAVIVGVKQGELIGIDGMPKFPRQVVGFVECLIYHKGDIVERLDRPQGSVVCAYQVK